MRLPWPASAGAIVKPESKTAATSRQAVTTRVYSKLLPVTKAVEHYHNSVTAHN